MLAILLLLVLLFCSAAAQGSSEVPSSDIGVSPENEICLGKFKIDELKQELTVRMEESHKRFRNFAEHQRSCILERYDQVLNDMDEDDCHLLSEIDRRVMNSLATCVEEIVILRDELELLKKQGILNRLKTTEPRSRQDFNASTDALVQRTQVGQQLQTSAEKHHETKYPLSLFVPSMMSSVAQTMNRASSLLGLTLFAKGDTVRSKVTLQNLPRSGRWFYADAEYANDCWSGTHWCCVFAGDDEDYNCFGIYCPDLGSSYCY